MRGGFRLASCFLRRTITRSGSSVAAAVEEAAENAVIKIRANLGNAASTIKISGLHGWMANAQTITANVHLANEGYQYGFNINNGGSGEVIYLGALPTDAATALYTNEDWTGSVTIQDFGILDDRNNNNRNHVRAEFPNKATVESWQNAGSRITFRGVKAWVTNGLSYDINLCLEDHIGPDGETVYAWHNDSGGSSSTTTFAKLSGTGTFYDNAACQHILKFTDVSDFSGNVRIQGKRLCLGSGAETPAVSGLSVANGATIAVGGQTWTAPGGIALGEEVSVKVAAGVTIPEAGMKVLGWNAKPTGGAFVKDETMPPISSLRVKTDGLYLSLQLPFIFLIK